MTPTRTPGRRHGAPAPAALLLLALCLLAGSAQALTDTPALVIDLPGTYHLDADLASDATVGVLINGSDVVFDGMGHTVAGTGANASAGIINGSAGILVSGRTSTEGAMGENVTVRNVTVSGWDEGIHIGETSDTVIDRVVAEQNGVGLFIAGSTGETDSHLVRDSVFRQNTGTVLSGWGILLTYPAHGIAIERCMITENSGGIYADEIAHGAPNNTLADSVISGNAGDGVSGHTGSFALVRNCTVSGNGDDGLEFEHGGAEIVGCHIEQNAAAGVHSSDRGGSQIHGNWIEGNGHGVLVGGDWPSTVWNNYLNNTDNGFFGASEESGMLNVTKSAGPNIVGGPFLGGNFWAHPDGTGFSQTHPDADRDGFVDEPYVANVEDNVRDFLPLAVWNGAPNGSTPYKPHPVPGRVEGEDYDLGGEGVAYHDTTPGNLGGAYRHDDVDIEVGGSNHDVGWIRTGEYLVYTVNVTQAGTYAVTARMASPNTGRMMTLSVDGQPKTTITVPYTGSFDTYREVSLNPVAVPTMTTPSTGGGPVMIPITLAAGTHTLKLSFQGDGQNLDWFELAPFAGPTPTPNGTPYKPLSIPGTIQAEDYNLGGEGVAYHDTTPGNEGGAYRHDDVDIEVGGSNYDVGWIRNGEYLTYTANVTAAGAYTMTANVASPNSGRTITVSVDGTSAVTIAVPNTGSFGAFRTVTVPVTLGAGTITIRLLFAGDGQNLDWIAFEPVGATPTPTPTPEAGGASFTAVPTTAPYGSAVKFTVTPASGKSIASAWWSFDAPAHLNTWNSRNINPTFFYPQRGTFSPLVKITYTDGSIETVQRTNYIQAT